jgi:DNA mismatch repair protein MutS2
MRGACPQDMNAIMDQHTLGLLEFDKIRELLGSYAASSLGKELARNLEPGTNATHIRAQLVLVSEMVQALDAQQAPPLNGLHDIRLTVRRASIGTMLSAEQLLEVGETLNCTGNVYRYRMRLDQRLENLSEMLASIEDFGPVARSIFGCIDGRGHVLDVASRELSQIRQKLFEVDEKVKNEIKRLLRDPELRKVLSYPNATVNGDHYVLPVGVNFRHKVEGIVHRVSGTGETVFIEPRSISHYSTERITLKAEEDREVKRILRRLSAEVGRIAKPLSFSLDVMAKLDFITAKAQYSRDFDMTAPDINTDGKLWLRNARHPILLNLFRQNKEKPREVVPIEVRLGLGFHMLIITGPNTGGKTVTLKTTGLLALMAQCGMHIPAAAGSVVPIFKHVLADIGDEQSLEQSLSTFSSHITRIGTILRTATEDSLVLLDELGAGTDPVEGAALGRAILDALDDLRCRAIVTTHLGDLKTYAFNNERAENGAVEFDIETLRPTYRLHIGQFGMSNALRIAKRLKLPKELLLRAHKYLRKKKGRTGDLARLQELKEQAEKAKLEALSKQHEADQQRSEYENKVKELEREANREAALLELRNNLKPGTAVRVSRFDAVGKVVKVNALKQLVTVSIGLGQWEVPFDEIFPVE